MDVVTVIPLDFALLEGIVIPFDVMGESEHGEWLVPLERSIASALAVPCMSGVVVVGDDARMADHLRERAHARGKIVDGRLYGPDITDLDRVIVIHHPGSTAALLNRGISELAADVTVCRLDAGDSFHPEIKQRQLAQLEITDELCSFSGHTDAITGATWLPSWSGWSRFIYLDNQFAASTTVFRRGVWEAVGGYDESLVELEDWDFAMRVQHDAGWSPFQDVTAVAMRRAVPARRHPTEAELQNVMSLAALLTPS